MAAKPDPLEMLFGGPKKPSKYSPRKCPKCGCVMKDGECEKCDTEEESRNIEIKLSILLPSDSD